MTEPSAARTEGWGFITNSRKWHYYTTDGRSLCRKYMKWSMADLDQSGDNSPDNCAECRRKLEALKAQP